MRAAVRGKLFLDPPRFGEEAGRERDITIYRAIYRIADSRVGQWSELGGRDIDGQTREGEQSG